MIGYWIASERKKIESEGWGKEVLSRQDSNGKWSGSLYDKKWVSTTYALLLLKELGLIPNQNTWIGCEQLFKNGLNKDSEIRFSSDQRIRDNGVTGLVLGLLCYFDYEDRKIHNIAEFLISQQQSDGTWLFDEKPGAEKYRFENTMIILRWLQEYQRRYKNREPFLRNAQTKAHEFFLNHKLIDRNNKKCLLFSFPFYWHYDLMVALD